MMNADKLHPALKGYQVWADALKPLFTELLGPPARRITRRRRRETLRAPVMDRAGEVPAQLFVYGRTRSEQWFPRIG